MKAVLVIDMPNRCSECPLCYKGENYWGDIVSAECQMQYKGYVALNEKPYWCPLRPLPQKKDVPPNYGMMVGDPRGEGWNECLKEILGETE